MTPNLPQKPELGEWLEENLGLPFRLPRLPFVQTAKNLDKAVATLVAASGENIAARVRASTARIEARSDAETSLIEYGTKQIENGDPALAARAREHAIGDILRAQANREEVLRHASEVLAGEAQKTEASGEIDDDWLNAFSKYAEQKSKEDVQEMWGRILAAEIRRPGATSLRTLHFLSTISSHDAQRIAKVFPYVVGGAFVPRYVLEKNLLSFDDLMHAQELDILSEVFGGLVGPVVNQPVTSIPGFGQVAALNYAKQQAIFQAAPEGEFKLSIPALPLSGVGRQLYALYDWISPSYAFFEELCLAIKPSNTTVVSLVGPTPGASRIIFSIPGA